MTESRFEAMRNDPSHWKLGVIYFCPQDPRVVVRQRFPIGWTWNFGNRWVLLGIVAAVSIFVGPAAVAWYLGVRSPIAYVLVFVTSLCVAMFLAHLLSRDPADRP